VNKHVIVILINCNSSTYYEVSVGLTSIGLREAARIKASLPRAEITGLWKPFQAIVGIMMMIGLMLPVMVLPGLIIFVLPAEIYLLDALYSRVSRAQGVTMSLPLESSVYGKRGIKRDFRSHTSVIQTGFSLCNK
jgi:hypothetical protein